MFKLAHWIGSNFPALKKVLLPVWVPSRRTAWKIRQNLFPGIPISIPICDGDGIKLMPSGQIAEMMWGLEFERQERDFVANYVKSGMTVVNVGANVGLYALMAAKLVGSTGHVFAFEPSSSTFCLLKKNISLNKVKNLTATLLALSDEKGRLVLKADRSNPDADGHRYVEKLNESTRDNHLDEVVDADTMDNFVQQNPLNFRSGIDLLIIDVEGAELSVLRGALSALVASRKLVILLECTKNQLEVKGILEKLGFSFAVWSMKEKALKECDFLSACAKGDVIAIRNS